MTCRSNHAMNGFTKLFQSILTSSVWSEDNETRIVWITMLALADQNGSVSATIPGLSRLAGVPIPAVEAALAKFQAPDPYSRTPDHEGRRVVKVEGGWRLINYPKYRHARDDEARRLYERERKREQRKERQATTKEGPGQSGTVRDNRKCPELSAQAEAEAEAEHTSDAKVGVQGESPWAVAFGLEMPETLRTAECMASIRAWLRHKAETRKSYKPSGLAVALGKWSREFTPPQFCAAVEHSMANGWSGIFQPKEPNGNATAGGRRLPSADRNDLISGADDDRGINAAIARDKANLANPDYLPFQ